MKRKVNIFHGNIIPAVSDLFLEPDQPRLIDSRHPDFTYNINNWRKWRLTYKAGDEFVNRYLEQFSNREEYSDFEARKRVTPVPAFAKAAINDIKNSIFQRMTDTTRQEGPTNYREAIRGNLGGVDRSGGSMNWFIGDQILPELLTMKKVGVFIDSPPILQNETQASRSIKHPYIYRYKAEHILNWSYRTEYSEKEFQSVLLLDYVNVLDPQTYLPVGCEERYRLLWIGRDQKVHVQYYNTKNEKIGSEIILQITKIPFVVFEISDSLLSDVASYQIALLNLKSTDISFALKSNFPFYTEQRNTTAEGLFAKRPAPDNTALVPNPTSLVPFDPTASCFPASGSSNGSEIKVGVVHGRSYSMGTDRPEFIHPSPEPLKASMELQDDLKEEIRLLINLALSNIKPQMASAESKAMDQSGLESGLSYIGLELEHGERQIGIIWSLYENQNPPTIKYPERYSLKTDEQQQKEADNLKKQLFTAASKTYQKEIVRRIAIILLGSKISSEQLAKILKEIDASPASTADPEILSQHLESGIVSTQTASAISGYDTSESQQAAKDHLDRVIRIAQAQTKNLPNPADRGVKDLAL